MADHIGCKWLHPVGVKSRHRADLEANVAQEIGRGNNVEQKTDKKNQPEDLAGYCMLLSESKNHHALHAPNDHAMCHSHG